MNQRNAAGLQESQEKLVSATVIVNDATKEGELQNDY